MTKLVLVLLVGLVLEAIGVVFLSRGLKVIGEMQQVSVSEILRMVVAGACLLYLMSHGEVSFVWPLTSLGFVLTTIAARFWLHETVVPLRWFGVFLIVLGAGIITYTEKYKKPEAAAATSMAAPAEK